MAEKILAIQGNSFKNLNIITDTTYLLALEAQRRNYKIYWYETKDISFINSKLIAEVCHIKFLENNFGKHCPTTEITPSPPFLII